MASFDVINAAGNAYLSSWNARHYLVRLAFAPLALKLLCYVMAWAFSRGEEGDAYSHYMTFMLIMLPAFFAEGWMLSHYTRHLVLGQTWPFRPTGNMDDDLAVLKVRARGVLSGMIVFVLVNMVMGFLIAMAGQYMMPYVHLDGAADADKIPPYVGLVSLVSLVGIFWGFRLLWLYIPLALNIDALDYLRSVRGFQTSLYMIGVWLVCFMPFFLALRLIAGLTAVPFGMAFGETGAYFIMIIFTVLADTLKSIVTTAGITFGLREIFMKDNKAAAR